MTFDEILEQSITLLQRQGRVSYAALKIRFNLVDDYLEALKAEIIEAQQLAIDENGRVLVWTGGTGKTTAAYIPEAERRQLTVMFCDLVDSTRLAGQLDPEEWREVVRAYQGACARVLQRFEGYSAQLLGDALLVYFGWPQAHEDDAQRAVRAGLGMLEAMGTLNARLEQEKRIRLAVRVGIHTGLVVVGEMGEGDRQEQLALGETPNIAARIQGIAEPDTIAISAVTFQLIEGYFTCQDLGSHLLKGVAMPVQIYCVRSESGAQSRLDIATTKGLTPLVGREQEVGLLVERWARAKEGMGQIVLLSGEAGIGKSRLVQVLKDRVAHEPHTRIECRSSPYYQNTAFYPITHSLQRILQWRQEDSTEGKLRKLETALSRYPLVLDEVVPLFAGLLSLALPEDRYPPLTMMPQRQRQKTLEVLLAILLEEAVRQPVLFIVEDLHWIDPSTLEFLSLVVDQGPTARLCGLFTFRPDFMPPWTSRTHLAPMALSRLTRQQIETMVKSLTGGKALPPEVLHQVVAKTDGVPLFVEEITKMVLESGLLREAEDHYGLTGPLPPLAIPTTLQDSLMARLDRLGTAKTVAQLGATLGREFSYALLQAVSPLDEATLQRELGRLVESELLYQRGVPPQATYLFKHALLLDAAYHALLKSTRQQYHQQIAQALAERFPETADMQPELLAHHYTEADLNEQAIAYWQRAGRRAYERSASLEAIAHLSKGLELLTTQPDTPERTQRELLLQTTLGPALMVAKGYAAPEVERAFARARELCQQMGETPQLFRVLAGLWNFYFIRGELQTARELGEQLLTLAQNVQNPVLLLRAHAALGETLFHLGELTSARVHLERGIALYAPQGQRSPAFVQDPRVACLSYAAWALWHLGYPDQALEMSDKALTLARELSDAVSLPVALNFAAILHLFRRDGGAAQERAEAQIVLSTERGFPLWLAIGTILRGWALAERGQGEEGVAQIRQGLTAWRATGAELWCPYVLALLAEASGESGQVEEGLGLLVEALAMADKTAERLWEAELHRLKGELLLIADGALRITEFTPEECFQRALDIARCQQAKSLELRAAMSLSRLWRQQGERDKSRQLLEPIYEWFTEGFDTADLQEARALLEELE